MAGQVGTCGIGAMIGPKRPAERAALSLWFGAAETERGALFVLELEPGGPAALSGQVRQGDELLAVDRQPVAHSTSQTVAELLSGKEGSLVKLRLRRNEATFDVCLQRDAVRHPPPERKSRTLNPAPPPPSGAADVLEQLSRSFAKVNQGRAVEIPAKMSSAELEVFVSARDAEVQRQENISKRCLDASKRRRAEMSVLERELRMLERQDAPFSQLLEYRNWIRRLQIEEELGPLHSANLDAVELEAEELELLERAQHLNTALQVVQDDARRSGPSEDEQTKSERLVSDVHVIRAKLRVVNEQLGRIRGVAADGLHAPKSDSNPALATGQAAEYFAQQSGGDQGGQPCDHTALANCDSDDEHRPTCSQRQHEGKDDEARLNLQNRAGDEAICEQAPSHRGGKSVSTVASDLAAELGSRWSKPGGEHRGVLVAAEGTLEDAPEPCMLAQSTVAIAQRLWRLD